MPRGKQPPIFFDVYDRNDGTFLFVKHPEALAWIPRWPYEVSKHSGGYTIRMYNVLAFGDLMGRLSRWGDPTYKRQLD